MEIFILAVAAFASSILAEVKTQEPHAPDLFETAHKDLHSRQVFEEGLPPLWNATFEQWIDHNDHSRGTFSQLYFYRIHDWKGPGSPIIVTQSGEAAAVDYTGLTRNVSNSGLFAQEIGGATILLEHRYFGTSSPFPNYKDLTPENLQYLTLNQSCMDLINFAQNVVLPFDPSGKSSPSVVPWILYGNSYVGSLTAFTAKLYPGTYWAYFAGSTPVQMITNFWQFYKPITASLPVNCSTDLTRVVQRVDEILQNGNAKAKHELRSMFGMEGVTHVEDFISTLNDGLESCIGRDFRSGYGACSEFCDAVEGVKAGQTDVPGPDGIGLKKALPNYASYINITYVYDTCGTPGNPTDVTCLNTYGPPDGEYLFDETVLTDPNSIAWQWMLCNELTQWKVGPPRGTPGTVSYFFKADYFERGCQLFFPDTPSTKITYRSSPNHKPLINVEEATNALTGGWNIPELVSKDTRIVWTYGEFDGWRAAGVSSDYRPGGPFKSKNNQLVLTVKGGGHSVDMPLANSAVNPDLEKLVQRQVKQVVRWVDEFYKMKKKVGYSSK